ncbi:hypothetical protein BSKO_11236 [Bryopsis sp. KO-2023]|nr:hypothetical protein BSKO_11236 [Bryopsis sp. KO-2023]
MSSFVGRLARTLSQGSGNNSDTTHRRISSSPDAFERAPVETKTRMSASPSFNDFSLRVEEDAEEMGMWWSPSWSQELPVAETNSTKNTAPMLSMTSTSSLQSVSSGTLLPAAAAVAPVSHTPSAPVEISAPKRRRPTIMGMDAYDYCDLIKSSSM